MSFGWGDRAATVASMERMKQIVANLKADRPTPTRQEHAACAT